MPWKTAFQEHPPGGNGKDVRWHSLRSLSSKLEADFPRSELPGVAPMGPGTASEQEAKIMTPTSPGDLKPPGVAPAQGSQSWALLLPSQWLLVLQEAWPTAAAPENPGSKLPAAVPPHVGCYVLLVPFLLPSRELVRNSDGVLF